MPEARTARLDYCISPGGRLSGHARVPGDKSISHRAVLLGGIAEGSTVVDGFLEGEDTLATLRALEAMGVVVERERDVLRLRGVGRRGLQAPAAALDLGNSGTGMRLLAGLLCGQPFASELRGDASLSSRPMGRIIEPLTRMGASIRAGPAGTAPLRIAPVAGLTGIDYRMPVASAQVKSSLLLAGLSARGRTTVTEPAVTRDHTERMLRGFGYAVVSDGPRVSIDGGETLTGQTLSVPGDLSSAAFLIVGASLAEGSELHLEGIGVNPTRDGVLRVLERMGAALTVERVREVGGEPVADLHVRCAALRGIEVPTEWVPLAIDEFPALLVAAAAARGTTVVRGAGELRVKETDRISAMADGLAALGVDCEPLPDGIVVHGGAIGPGRVDSRGDHRIAMAFAMAGLVANGPVEIADCRNVATSFPGFVELVRGLGLRITAGDVSP